MLWPEYDQASASQAFRQTLYTARRNLGKNLLPSIGKQILLDDSGKISIDVKEFQVAIDAGSGIDITPKEAITFLQRAAAFYQGDFLAGFTLKDSLEFDDWQSFQTHSLRQKYGRVLEALVRHYMAHELHDQALKHALRQVQLDQMDELAHRNVIQAYARMGQRIAALQHYDKYEQILARELQINPSEEIYKLRDMIMAEETIPLPSSPVHGGHVSVQVPGQEKESLLEGDPPEQLPGAAARAAAQDGDSGETSTAQEEPNVNGSRRTFIAPGHHLSETQS
jgi:DNA-binding SARP family transcriptional activator